MRLQLEKNAAYIILRMPDGIFNEGIVSKMGTCLQICASMPSLMSVVLRISGVNGCHSAWKQRNLDELEEAFEGFGVDIAPLKGAGPVAHADSIQGVVNRIDSLKIPVIATLWGNVENSVVGVLASCQFRTAHRDASVFLRPGCVARALRMPSTRDISAVRSWLSSNYKLDMCDGEDLGLITRLVRTEKEMEEVEAIVRHQVMRVPDTEIIRAPASKKR